jgi:hypothetical protein
MKVVIDLQEGFENDEVEIFDNEKRVFKADNVKTRTQIGLASSNEVDLEGNKATLRVEVPSRNIDERREIQLTDDLHIAISISDGNELTWKIQNSPFFYM